MPGRVRAPANKAKGASSGRGGLANKPPSLKLAAKAVAKTATKQAKAKPPKSAPTSTLTLGESARHSAIKQRRKEARKAQGLTRAELRQVRKGLTPKSAKTGPKASALSLGQAFEKFRGKNLEPTEEAYQTHLSEFAPRGIQVVRALTGDKPGESSPTLGEIKNVALTLGTEAVGAGIVRSGIKAATAARTAKAVERAATARRAAPATRKATQTAKAANRTRRARAAKRTSETARKTGRKVKVRYSKPERAVRRAQRVERATGKVTHPAALPIEASEVGRAFVEGTVEADPKKAAATTAKAIPATLAFGATALADVARSGKRVIEGDPKPLAPLKGTVEEAKGAITALEPLISGDPEQVKEATEESLGYVFAPLLPSGLHKAGKPARALRSKIAEALPDRPVPEGTRGPGKVRRAGQVVTGRKTRKKVATLATRNLEPERVRAERAEAKIQKPARKAKKSRRVTKRHGITAEDAIPTLRRYGISREGAKAQLDKVARSLEPKSEERRNVTAVKKWLDENPDVLDDPRIWEASEEAKGVLREVETSPRAKYMAQGRVLGVKPPEERITPKTADLSGTTNRAEAWDALNAKRRELKAAKTEARKHLAKATEARGARREELKDIAVAHRNNAKRLEGEVRELAFSLRPFTKPGGSLKPPAQRRFVTREGEAMEIQTRRKPWNRQMVEEFVSETKARAAEEGFDEPSWLAEKTPALPGEGISPPYPAAGRAPRVKSGSAEHFDLVDRSFRSMLGSSVRAPRMQRGLDRFVRDFTEQMSHRKVVGGKERIVVSSAEAQALIKNAERKGVPAEQKIDLRKEVLLPSRQFQQPIRSADFDLPQYHTDIAKRVRGELDLLEDAPGTKYVVVGREAAVEFADQINPQAGLPEEILGALGTAGTRLVLFTPAWTMAQFVAEGLQAFAAQGTGFVRALARNERFRTRDPKGYEDWAAIAGESRMAYETAAVTRLDMDGGLQGRFADGIQAFNRTKVGRAVMATGTLKIFGLFDRWKTGKFRSAVLAAKADKALNGKRGFIPGVQGMTKTAARVSAELKGKSKVEQQQWLAENPKVADEFLDYLDDTQGNWNAFSRFEKQFSPALMFYPYLRMSLRWGFWSFPKRHPVRAQILYLLAQRNREELSQLLGHEPDFLESAMPVVHGEEGRADLVLPGGRRFGTPALNALVESIGEDNIAGVFRALNPALSTAVYGLTGVDPMSGRQEQDDPNRSDMLEHGLLALNQLLSLAPPARYFGLNEVGQEQTEAGAAFDRIDPLKDERSVLNPFIPLSGERARLQSNLGKAYETRYETAPEVTYAEAIDAVTSGDRAAQNALKRRQEKSEAAKDVTATVYEGGEELTDAQWEQVARILGYRKFPYEKPKKKKSSGSSGGSVTYAFGGRGTGTSGGSSGGSSTPGYAFD